MSRALRIFQGRFGRVALLDMTDALVDHAHPHCHVLFKAGGADSSFVVGGRVCPLRDDTTVLVNSWVRHRYVHRPGAPRTIVLALYIEPAWVGALDRSFRLAATSRFFDLPCATIDAGLREMRDQLVAALLACEVEGEAGERVLAELVLAVSARFARRSRIADLTDGFALPSDYRIRRTVRAMSNDLERGFDPERYARIAGLSRAHFFRRFRDTTGLTPQLYFNVMRMENAIRALAFTPSSIAQISERLGFPAQSHFTRFFKGQLGICPTDYRRALLFAGPEGEIVTGE